MDRPMAKEVVPPTRCLRRRGLRNGREVQWSYGEEKGEAIMKRSCSHCDNLDSSLLRIVLIGEIIRADEAALYTMAEIFQTLGLLELSQEDDVAEVKQVAQEKTRLRLVK